MKTLYIPFSQMRTWLRSSSKASLPAALLLVLAQNADAQDTFPRFENFTTNTAAKFTLGGAPTSARLTGTTATSSDGFLRLTDATQNQSGYVIDQLSFPAPKGFSVSFEFFSYGGTGADGFSVFLIDADKTTASTFTSGASGGSLGYAQKTVDPISNGVPNGYIGIGIDEFGNFANPTEGRVGGPGSRPDAISVRGPGNGRGATDYQYLGGSGSLPFSLDVPTRVTDPKNANYRRAYIDVVPQGTAPNITYKITVRIQHGTEITKAIDNLTVATPPDRLRIGFAGSTGGSTNIHEIRNLAIVQAPIANDDLAGTIYNQPVTLNVLNNDIFYGTDFKPGSVDLDISTAGVQSTYTVTGKGTFSATADGLVTFTPSGTFAGVVTLPYLMQDLAGSTNVPQYFSNPGTITIIVEGADISTTISGPTSANPGSRITYTVNTSNLGTQAATNVKPTLQLAPNLPTASVSVTNGTYNASNGLVTFDAIANLASGDANPTVNSVSIIAPDNGNVTGTTSYVTTAPAVPDPVATNNTATITTVITGIKNAAGVCATPGKDGPATLDGTTTPNTYYPGTASAAIGATSILVGTAAGSTTPIVAGDLLLVMQMQGAEISTTNGTAYGAGTNTGSGSLGTNYTAGTYEYVTAAGPVANGAVPLTMGLVNAYTNAGMTATVGVRRFQVIRVPQYSSLSVTGVVSGAAWNGETGGILALDVAGETSFTSGSLNMTGKGFRGGGGKLYTGISGYVNTDRVRTATAGPSGAHASKGEGIVGTPLFVNNDGVVLTNTAENYPSGSLGQGAPGNAGGGGSDGTPDSNTRNTGGGGGANGGAGGIGGEYNGSNSSYGGRGGAAINSASASRLTLGGGGGAGTNNNTINNANTSSGGDGGGIIIFRTGSVTGTASIVTDGEAGKSPSANDDAAGGGGAGGTVLVAVQSTGISNIRVQANGGKGGNSTSSSNSTQYGNGGGGGGGQAYANGTVGSSSLAGGTNGDAITANGSTAVNGATSGATATITNATIPQAVASVGACLPTFDVELSTSTRNVARQANRSVSPATYTLLVTNLGGSASSVSSLVSLTANIFAYDPAFTPVATLQLADETGNTGNKTAATNLTVTAPTTATSTPSFGIGSIPAGATVSITFRATVASTAIDGFAYQADATVTYLDPTRTNTQRVGPGSPYASGGATAGGSNYGASSSSREDVIVARPLPVELKRFEVAAKGLNAELTWATASELQNDHFNIERSLDGQNFERINVVKGQGTSAHETAYRFTDAGAGRLSLKPIYYRLQQVDLDGSSSYSPIRVVKFERGLKAAIALYPNPHQGTATLDLTALSSLDSQVEVMDISGRVVGKFQLLGGLQHPLDLNALPLGSYLIRVRNAETVVTLPMVRN
ncbi:T9SS type A sorting domain-containing protein [Hymenobacter sp. YC55]|uniref:T9SS type A sorting domain-containing protein n=1 Tax=Hymenobacter sp. YC55 TaxID=3034019 RepID=UPI0023F8204B|nr:T9SS type A sorting domain-containing protein [Hymenobacter sp. YC55]MDF7811141.1 T9SS type A sorting domain-containing protein [Hymenobacter sp. YC55]